MYLVLIAQILFLNFASADGIQDVIPDAAFWLHQKTSSKSCNDFSSVSAKNINSIMSGQGAICPEQKSSSANDWVESVFFQKAAQDELSAMKCDLKEANLAQLSVSATKQIAEQMAAVIPQLKVLYPAIAVKNADRIHQENIVNIHQGQCRNSISKSECQDTLAKETEKLVQINKELHYLQTIRETLHSQIWNFQSNEVQNFISTLAKQNENLSVAQLESQMPTLMAKVQAEFTQNIQDLKSQGQVEGSKIIYNSLNARTKRRLVENWTFSDTYKQDIQNSSADYANLSCRLEAKYSSGQDKLFLWTGVATFFSGFAIKAISKIPVVAESVFFTSAGRLSTFGKLATNLSVLTDAAVATSSLLNKCLGAKPPPRSSRQCLSNTLDLQGSIEQNFRDNHCLVTEAYSMAPAGVLATVAALKVSSAGVKTLIQKRSTLAPSGEIEKLSAPNSITPNSVTPKSRVAEAFEPKPDVKNAVMPNSANVESRAESRSIETNAPVSNEMADSPSLPSITNAAEDRIFSAADLISKALRRTDLSSEQIKALKNLDDQITELSVSSLGDQEKSQAIREFEKKIKSTLRPIDKAEVDTKHAANAATKSATNTAAASVVQTKTPLTLGNLFSKTKPENLQFHVPKGSDKTVTFEFASDALESFQAADQVTQKKLVQAMFSSHASGQMDPTKVKLLSGIPSGSAGRPFEVRIVGRGHKRLLGCEKAGVFKVVLYDPEAPESVSGYAIQYKNLCR